MRSSKAFGGCSEGLDASRFFFKDLISVQVIALPDSLLQQLVGEVQSQRPPDILSGHAAPMKTRSENIETLIGAGSCARGLWRA